MRVTASGLVVLAAVSAGFAQPAPRSDKEPPARYGIVPTTEFYPQGTAKEALASVSKLLENKRYFYLAAHALDPAVVDARVAEKARGLMADAEKALTAAREEQRRNPEATGTPIPADPAGFAEVVRAEADKRAFALVAKAIAENLAESPENVKLFAKFARDGVVTEGAGGATVSLKELPGRQVFLKQVGNRWFVEDRMQAEKPKDEGKPKAEK